MNVVISGAGLWIGTVTQTDTPNSIPTRADIVARCLADALGSARLGPLGESDFVINVAQLSHSHCENAELREFHGPDPRAFLPRGVPWVTITHACASVLFAMRLASTLLSRRRCERVVVTGAFTPTVYDNEGMRILGTLGQGQARPFSCDRDGTALGVGGGALIFERPHSVRQRDLRPLARVLGVDARIVTEPRAGSDPAAIERCILGALRRAETKHVDSIEAHATGTIVGDLAELVALENLASRFDWHGVPVSATKSLTGHLLQAAGLPSVIAACHALRGTTGVAPRGDVLRTTLGLQFGGGAPASARATALVNAFGFSGNYAAAVLSLDGTDEHPNSPLPPLERTSW